MLDRLGFSQPSLLLKPNRAKDVAEEFLSGGAVWTVDFRTVRVWAKVRIPDQPILNSHIQYQLIRVELNHYNALTDDVGWAKR